MAWSAQTWESELPPRARRIQHPRPHHHINHGTTSACAENTSYRNLFYTAYGNYLRVRGEYHRCGMLLGTVVELPPRARRIHHWHHPGHGVFGTTSACAENTGRLVETTGTMGNYLRVRGEYHPTPKHHGS